MAMLLIAAMTLAMAEDNPHPISTRVVTFYDILSSHGLPIGIFPKGISDFSVDPTSGGFRLRLPSPSPCETVFETRLRYECDITGRISYGRISDLTGVTAQELLLWIPVVSKQFSLSLFETLKDCTSPEEIDGYADMLKIPQEAELWYNVDALRRWWFVLVAFE
ncbi:uncharacterized protein LOC121764552 [Salvia splendens]|uniref:uncharacterized protein LOC121764552 n=1 Tax=Salvia splendens TaxID=180675 RepID=UPI001C2617A8|nr:uncharacterized protein LOC121764552 [Salvia splendens]